MATAHRWAGERSRSSQHSQTISGILRPSQADSADTTHGERLSVAVHGGVDLRAGVMPATAPQIRLVMIEG